MVPNPDLMKAVDALDYRVTPGDVASQSGLDIKQAEQGLLALASQAKGHLQVSESGEIAYLFPRNYRTILRNASLRLRLREWWQRVWKVLFYLIRISFGIILILSILIISLAILFLMIAVNRGGDNDSDSSQTNFYFFPSFLMRGMMYDLFSINYYQRQRRRYGYDYGEAGSSFGRSARAGRGRDENSMNFLEAVFSFLFGDGNPNADLEERRWQYIAGVIRNNGGAIAAEQVLPYLDLDPETDLDDEDYMLPVLLRFNGRPEVSPEGNIIYHFPALQVMAEERGKQSVPEVLRERQWKFSEAGSGQLTWAGGLGALNLAGAAILGVMLRDPALPVELYLGGVIGIVDIVYGVLLVYAIAFVTIPTLRYFWIKRKNEQIDQSNQKRLSQANRLDSAPEMLQQKIEYAKQFASQTVVSPEDLTYTTETGLTEQEALRSDDIDEEWRRRIEGLR